MKVVLFAGGKGTRISEESHLKPKPMIEIGGKPILWHIMKIYSAYDVNEFVICLGYKGEIIKNYFLNYFMYNADCTVDLATNSVDVHHKHAENFKISLVDTGLETLTAGRLRRVKDYIGDEDFLLTYGDGVADVNIKELIQFHNENGKICTMTGVQPGNRFGVLEMDNNNVVKTFTEKPKENSGWINGGFFVLKPEVFNYLHDDADDIMWEAQPLSDLSKNGEIVVYKHHGFWKCMDTLRDKVDLEKLWNTNPPWRIWE
ncbi:MAG: glucose-1-phosphate cytidylyltransferase [Crocinitomicaceae bacterium]|nr:glucose-1-phosphate cytidylyltransferase [Crocinitomicaceae bacterium]